MKMKILLATLLASNAAAASAYEIKAKQSVHEAITRLALQCLEQQQAKDAPPNDCGVGDDAIEKIAKHTSSLRTNFNRLEAAPRWSDDPTRDLYSPFSFLKFLWGTAPHLENCERGRSATGLLAVPHGRGLLCASHYGRLQFLHSMAAPDEDARLERTRRKVLDWAVFTYSAATDRIDLEEDHCSFWRQEEERTGTTIGRELAPAGFPYCADQKKKNNWKVATLFSLRCWAPSGAFGCSEYVGTGRTRARRAAAGALLHVIQDSYSQSHVARGSIPEELEFRPRADCGRPTRIYAYSPANRAHHGKADTAPPLGEKCRDGDRPAVDVVTASAGAIWHLCRNSEPEDVRTYLAARVFGEPGERAKATTAAGARPGAAAPFPKPCRLVTG